MFLVTLQYKVIAEQPLCVSLCCLRGVVCLSGIRLPTSGSTLPGIKSDKVAIMSNKITSQSLQPGITNNKEI